MGPENRIRILPIHVANKIAAGEVVERPASVVKELVENAIDAGATQVDVFITAGGRKRIAVVDNGSGMPRDDALLSIERQATSKIQDIDDIEQVRTLGFRGEALAAIASACRFRLTTAAAGESTGTEVVVTGGQVQDVREVGSPPGTTIEVRDLFFNIPARRKFLRAQQTELAHVRSGFLVQALANFAVGMRLQVDGRDVYQLPAGGTFIDRVRDLFGADYLEILVPVDHADGGVRVHGFVSGPGLSRADREEQYVFVNGRAATSPVIGYAIREGFRNRLPKDRHPSVFLFIELDLGMVDVNVHPTKREVRFRHSSAVRDALLAALQRAWRESPDTAGDRSGVPDGPQAPPSPPPTQLQIDGLPQAQPFSYRKARQEPHHDGPGFGRLSRPPDPVGATPASAPSPQGESGFDGASAADDASSPWAWCRVVGVVGGKYVLLETEDGTVAMDPGAAHERVLYEHFMVDVARRRVSSQHLLMPETVELRPQDALRVRKHLALLKTVGFGVSEFGGDAFVVDAMPAHFAGASARALLVDFAGELEAAGGRRGEGLWREELLARAACRAAVRARDRLKLEEIEQLVRDLSRTEMPYTCPRGRPTLIFTSFKELERKFGRT